MPYLQTRYVALDPPESWFSVAADGQGASAGLASEPWSMPAFFLGWIGFGVLIGLALGRRGHDRRLMVAMGAGLGPLMAVVASNAVTRRRAASPLVLSPGGDHGGDLDILVLITDRADGVRSVVPTLIAVASEVRVLTLARAVPYEWLEGDDNEVVEAASSVLVEARELVPIHRPALVVFPGRADDAVQRFVAAGERTLILHAIEESPVASDRW